MGETKNMFRLFWAWNLEKEAAWLSEMSASGWHLLGCGFGVYRFERGKREDRVYELDFMLLRGTENSEYFQLYADAGWTHAASFANWHYFHAPVDQATRRPAYSDDRSRRSKLVRVLTVLALAILPVGVFGLVNPILNGYFRDDPIYYAIGGFAVFIMVIFIYAGIRIAFKIRRDFTGQ